MVRSLSRTWSASRIATRSKISSAKVRISKRLCSLGLYDGMSRTACWFTGIKRLFSETRLFARFRSLPVCPLSTSLRVSLRMSLCQLRLAALRPRYVLKNGSSKRGTRESAIHHQLDRVDVRGIVRCEEEHGFGDFFRLAPTALRNRRRKELRQLGGILCGSGGAGPALPNGSFDRAWCDDVHANVARCKVGGDGTRHRDETPLGGCVCGDARLAEIVMYRPTEDDASVVVQQRRR